MADAYGYQGTPGAYYDNSGSLAAEISFGGPLTEFSCPATAPATSAPTTGATPQPLGAYTPAYAPTTVSGQPFRPLHTSGNQIVDSLGNVVRLKAVNWYGAESADYVPMGLDKQSVTGIASWIANHGFNAVRLPWSNELVECNPTVSPQLVSPANSTFANHPAMWVFDQVVNALAQAGLMVILDNHMTDAGWCCSDHDNNGLWWSSREYHSDYTDFQTGQAHWQADWATMVDRYASQPAVVGVDLRNEPRSAAYWGGTTAGVPDGSVADSSQQPPNSGPSPCPVQNSNLACDWRAAAQAEGNIILGLDRNLLIFVEGTSYATDLTGAYSSPVTLEQPSQLVYSPHVYAYSGYCNANARSQCPGGTVWEAGKDGHPPSFDFLANWKDIGRGLDSQWGYLAESGDSLGTITPIFIGEFGTNAWNSPGHAVKIARDSDQNRWIIALIKYLQNRQPFGWAYWALNGTQSDGAPFDTSRVFGKQEIYGVLDTGWGAPPLPYYNTSLVKWLSTIGG